MITSGTSVLFSYQEVKDGITKSTEKAYQDGFDDGWNAALETIMQKLGRPINGEMG